MCVRKCVAHVLAVCMCRYERLSFDTQRQRRFEVLDWSSGIGRAAVQWPYCCLFQLPFCSKV